jgi:hypothetical protein
LVCCAQYLSLCPIHHPRKQVRNDLDIAIMARMCELSQTWAVHFYVNIKP